MFVDGIKEVCLAFVVVLGLQGFALVGWLASHDVVYVLTFVAVPRVVFCLNCIPVLKLLEKGDWKGSFVDFF